MNNFCLLLRNKGSKYLLFSVVSLLFVYTLQFVFAKFFEEETFGLLKKILFIVNYLGIVSFGFRDEFYHELCQNKGNLFNRLWNKYFPPFLIINFASSPLYILIGVYVLELDYGIVIGIYLYVLSTISLTFVESLYYGRNKQDVFAKKKMFRDSISALSVFILFFIDFSDEAIIVSYFYLVSTANLSILLYSDVLWEKEKNWRISFIPIKGLKIQLGNILSQISLTIDRLLGVILLPLSGFALYSFNFLSVQAILLLAGMAGSYSYRNHFNDETKILNKRILIGSILSFLVLIPVFITLHLFFPKYSLSLNSILYLSIGTAFNAYYQSFLVNKLRMLVQNYLAITLVIIVFSISLLYIFGSDVKDLIIIYMVSGIFRVTISKAYIWKISY